MAGNGLTSGYRLNVDAGASQMVFNDADVDTLTGSQGKDWFFANQAADNGGVLDCVTDQAASCGATLTSKVSLSSMKVARARKSKCESPTRHHRRRHASAHRALATRARH
jgi:hypothetical protein